MKIKLLILQILICSVSFAQEKSYRFVYDFHQNVELDEETKRSHAKDFLVKIQNALNESYEFEIIASEKFSFLKLIEKINNGQSEDVIRLHPDPKWLLVDFQENETFNFIEVADAYLKDSIQTIQLKPTRNKKVILGIESREFTAEKDNYDYSFWLAQQNGITVSPIEYQFKGYIVLELNVKSKRLPEYSSSKDQQYILKEITEEKLPFNYNKIIPKKTKTKDEIDALIKKIHEMIDDDNGVEK